MMHRNIFRLIHTVFKAKLFPVLTKKRVRHVGNREKVLHIRIHPSIRLGKENKAYYDQGMIFNNYDGQNNDDDEQNVLEL